MMRLPTDDVFVAALARAMCLHAGDSWIADDGAQDQYLSDAEEIVELFNDMASEYDDE